MNLSGAAGAQGPGFEIQLLAPLGQLVSLQPRSLGLLAVECGSGSPRLPRAPPSNKTKPARPNLCQSPPADGQTTALPSPSLSSCVDKVGTRHLWSCQKAWKGSAGSSHDAPGSSLLSSSLLMGRRQSGPGSPRHVLKRG